MNWELGRKMRMGSMVVASVCGKKVQPWVWTGYFQTWNLVLLHNKHWTCGVLRHLMGEINPEGKLRLRATTTNADDDSTTAKKGRDKQHTYRLHKLINCLRDMALAVLKSRHAAAHLRRSSTRLLVKAQYGLPVIMFSLFAASEKSAGRNSRDSILFKLSRLMRLFWHARFSLQLRDGEWMVRGVESPSILMGNAWHCPAYRPIWLCGAC
jgi:hypothetical protein